jgi:8-oxo-dGTP pyrophosphatase MutT (NUDIX family)
MVRSAGIVVVWQDKVLLVHPTQGTKTGSWGIPKGKIEEGELIYKAALREFQEETGIVFNNLILNKLEGPYEIDYTRPQNSLIYKKIYYWILRISDLSELGIWGNSLPHSVLQKEEIDKACFVKREKAKELLFWRWLPMLDTIWGLE